MSTKIILGLFILFSHLTLTAQTSVAHAESLYEEALADYRDRDLEAAEKNIAASLYLSQSAKANYLSGLIYEALGRDLRAVSAYEAALKLDPDYQEAVFQKALIYLNHGDPAQALKDLNQLIAFDGVAETRGLYFQEDPSGNKQTQIVSLAKLDGQLYHYRGQAYEKLERLDEALADYNEALSHEMNEDYLISRGLLQSRMGHQDLAIKDLKDAVKLNPKNHLAWYNLAILDTSAHLPDDLLKETTFAPTLGLLASRAMEEENYVEAKKYFDQCLENDPKDPLAYVNRGRVLLKMEEYAAARTDFHRAKLLDPGRTETLYLLGNSYFFEKDVDVALAYYNQYLAFDPTNAMVWYNGAMVHLEKDNKEEACQYLNKAYTLGMTEAKKMTGRYCR